MQIIRNFNNIPKKFITGTVLTIGDFDGVHLGHQQLLTAVVEDAKQLNYFSVVLIFEPQPQEFFLRNNLPVRINSLREKLFSFKQIGVDYVVIQRFNKEMANVRANVFVENMIINKLHVKELIVGYDFKFGKNREGDTSLLKSIANERKIIFKKKPAYLKESQIISSSLIRSLLQNNEFDKAEKNLGRKFFVICRVKDSKYYNFNNNYILVRILKEKHKFPLMNGIYNVKIILDGSFIYVDAYVIRVKYDNKTLIFVKMDELELKKDIFKYPFLLEFHRFVKQLDTKFYNNIVN